MITQEFISSEKSKSVLKQEDLDTTGFILSLYESDHVDITEASNFLENYISPKTPIEGLALKYIAHNFQYYKQADDTIIYELGFDNVYCALLEHSVLGFYALLKEFISPSTEDWALEQIRTFSPLTNSCFEKDCWVSKKRSISLEWGTASRMLADIICSKFDQNISSINKRLYKKLDEKNLALFFDIEESYEIHGFNNYHQLKNLLLF